MENIENIILQNNNGGIFASSREVTDKFGKRHDKLTSEIKRMYSDLIGYAQNGGHPLFIENSYINEQNKQEYKEYLMSRDGFSLLVMGFTGKEALDWKLKYIKAFNDMENAIRNSLSSKDSAILAIVNAKDDLSRASAITTYEHIVTAPLIEELETQKPLVDFANTVHVTNDLINVGQMAKLLKDESNIDVGGRNKFFEWLRDSKILMKDNAPYQQYIEQGYFKVKEASKENQFGSKVFCVTYITGKGQLWLIKKIKENIKTIG